MARQLRFALAARREAVGVVGQHRSGRCRSRRQPGTEDTYSPANASTQIFDSLFLKVDSDQAFATAQKHGGDKVLEATPENPVTYICDWNHVSNELVWHVIYGSKLRVAVNASTGEFIRVEK